MRAEDLCVPLPLIRRETTAVEAARLIAAGRLPGLVVGDDSGVPIAVLSASDLLGLMVPPYVLDDMSLAGVFDERAAEELWATAETRLIGELLDDQGVRLDDILEVDADANLIEMAAQMVHAHAQIALVRGPGGEPGYLLLPDVVNAILRFVAPGEPAS